MGANHVVSPWTYVIMARFRELYATGASHSIIAATLNAEFGTNFSRHSCIGRANRLKFEPRPSPIRETKAKRTRERKTQGPPKGWKQTPFQIRPLEQPRYLVEEPNGPGITMNMLRNDTCKWPVVDLGPATFLYCGHTSEKDRSWCSHHHIVGKQPRRSRTGGIRAWYR